MIKNTEVKSDQQRQLDTDRMNRERSLKGEEAILNDGTNTQEINPADRPYAHGGLTEEEAAARRGDPNNIPPDPVKDKVAEIVRRLRVETTYTHDLISRYDKGIPTTRENLGQLKTRVDQIVRELAEAVGIQ